jgi:hypothetical protein
VCLRPTLKVAPPPAESPAMARLLRSDTVR